MHRIEPRSPPGAALGRATGVRSWSCRTRTRRPGPAQNPALDGTRRRSRGQDRRRRTRSGRVPRAALGSTAGHRWIRYLPRRCPRRRWRPAESATTSPTAAISPLVTLRTVRRANRPPRRTGCVRQRDPCRDRVGQLVGGDDGRGRIEAGRHHEPGRIEDVPRRRVLDHEAPAGLRLRRPEPGITKPATVSRPMPNSCAAWTAAAVAADGSTWTRLTRNELRPFRRSRVDVQPPAVRTGRPRA